MKESRIRDLFDGARDVLVRIAAEAHSDRTAQAIAAIGVLIAAAIAKDWRGYEEQP